MHEAYQKISIGTLGLHSHHTCSHNTATESGKTSHSLQKPLSFNLQTMDPAGGSGIPSHLTKQHLIFPPPTPSIHPPLPPYPQKPTRNTTVTAPFAYKHVPPHPRASWQHKGLGIPQPRILARAESIIIAPLSSF